MTTSAASMTPAFQDWKIASAARRPKGRTLRVSPSIEVNDRSRVAPGPRSTAGRTSRPGRFLHLSDGLVRHAETIPPTAPPLASW